ncbi:MAG: hypothetical protein J6X02_04200, partial [Bacilli bacterium]|nr:hypothetical protein [Bacilli bacterium]
IIITGLVNVLCTLINYICARFFEFLPIGFHIQGGEYDGYTGFGILLEKIYPMTSDPSTGGSYMQVSFSFTDFLVFLGLSFILVFVIVTVIRLLRGKKK